MVFKTNFPWKHFESFVLLVFTLQVTEASLNQTNSNKIANLQPLDLCDCHFVDSTNGATAAHELSCEKSGFFIAGFRAAGYVSGHRNELLPLSPAICCRPCLPKDSEGGDLMSGAAENKDDVDNTPVAVISRNCHQATLTSQEQCGSEGPEGSEGSGFLQGFERGQIGTPVSYYPSGVAQCCEPTVLLKSGKVRPLVRCMCEEATHSPSKVTCASMNTPDAAASDGRLIWGFGHVHDIYGHYPVASAPAKCCKTCLDVDQPPQNPQHCEDLNFCNGHGECRFGRCECHSGYSGLACSDKRNRNSFLPQKGTTAWAMTMIVISGVFLGCCSRIMLCVCRRRAISTLNHHQHNQQDLEQPMLRPDETSSSAEEWSTDTDDDQFDQNQQHRPPPPPTPPVPSRPLPSGAQQPTAATVVNATPSSSSSLVSQGVTATQGDAPVGGDGEAGAVTSADAIEEVLETTRGGVTAEQRGPEDTAGQGEGGGGGENVGVGEAEVESAADVVSMGAGAGGLQHQGLECLVCMSSPIQVVCVPCGHACMCRKCSRRLRRCPLCRNEVTRRQKLYLGI